MHILRRRAREWTWNLCGCCSVHVHPILMASHFLSSFFPPHSLSLSSLLCVNHTIIQSIHRRTVYTSKGDKRTNMQCYTYAHVHAAVKEKKSSWKRISCMFFEYSSWMLKLESWELGLKLDTLHIFHLIHGLNDTRLSNVVHYISAGLCRWDNNKESERQVFNMHI